MTAPVPPTPPFAGVDGSGLLEPSLEELYEHAPCGYLSTTPAGVVVKVNETFLAWTGYARAQLVGTSFADLLTVGSRLFYDTRCLPALQLRGEVREVALVLRCSEGQPLSILINSTVRLGDDGLPRLVRIAVFDATGRQDSERDLLSATRAAERSEARVRILQEASESLGTAKTEQGLAVALAEITGRAFDATCSTVMLVDRATKVLAALPAGAHPLGDSMPLDSSRPEAEAVRTGGLVTIFGLDDAERRFPALVEPMHAARFDAMTVAPLLADDAPLGVTVCLFGWRREFDDDETDLQRALARQGAQAVQHIRLQEQLQHLALHDKLTGLANRELLQFRLVQVITATSRHRLPMALIFLDLDGFKAINDQLGHVVGDGVLTQVSDRLRRVVRSNDTVARFGGDEFVVVCEDIGADAADGLAKRILAAMRKPLPGIPAGFPLTASVGVARHQPAGRPTPDADAMIVQADAALYRSKNGGKDRHTVVDV